MNPSSDRRTATTTTLLGVTGAFTGAALVYLLKPPVGQLPIEAIMLVGAAVGAAGLISVGKEVQAGEGSRTLALALNAFVLMFSYYLLRVVRETLILTESGAEIKTYSSAWQALLLMAAVPAYGAFAARVNRISLITYVTLFFVANLVLFAAGGFLGLREGVVFFVWVGIFNMMVMAQFWAFANDLHSEGAGKRLFAAIMLGANLGATFGGQAAKWMSEPLGSYGLMLIAAGLLAVCIPISRKINARAVAVQRVAEIPLGDVNVFQIMAKDRYLQMIALLMILLNFVNTTGEYLLGGFVAGEAARIAAGNEALQKVIVSQFYGDYSSLYSLLGMVLQLFLVSRIFRHASVGAALMILPLIALTGYSMILAVPLLGMIRWVKIFENGTDYSIQNTARQALFLPTTREAKYKAKAAIDSFFVRMGDVFSAGLVYVGVNWVVLGVKGFAAANLILTLAWLGVAFAVAREYRRRTRLPGPVATPPPMSVAPTGANQGAVA